MKIKIGPYTNWFGPYQLAEALCFWVRKVPDEHGFPTKPDWVHSFGEWLAHGNIKPETKVGESYKWDNDRSVTWHYKFLTWVDSKKKRKVKIRIDRYDTWGMDSTLSMIIVPMLKQLKATKHGSPYIEAEDVPKHLHPDPDCIKFSEDGKPIKWDPDYKVHERWDWVLDEMIYAFECALDDDWDNQFYSGEHDIYWQKKENGLSEMVHGPKDTWTVDRDAMKAAWDRRDNGRRLFAKYFHNLWD